MQRDGAMRDSPLACKKQLLCNNVHVEGHGKAKRATRTTKVLKAAHENHEKLSKALEVPKS